MERSLRVPFAPHSGLRGPGPKQSKFGCTKYHIERNLKFGNMSSKVVKYMVYIAERALSEFEL